jgi:calcium-translocating P-type ATPase
MNKRYCQISFEEALEELKTSKKGLSRAEVEKRRLNYGYNDFKEKKISFFTIFIRQYANFLMILLLFGAVISFFLREWTDGFVILAILIINGILGATQEHKAEQLLKTLQKNIPQKVMVRRNNREVMVDNKELIPGDIVILNNGQIIPADLRVVSSSGLIIDESPLTGESIGVAKERKKLAQLPKNINEMVNILFSGTTILAGSGEGLVIAIGEATEFGKIVQLTRESKRRSSFLKQVQSLSDFLLKTTIVTVVLLFILLLIFKPDFGLSNVFLFTVALAIAIVPEMLPLISTIALTGASLKLIKKGVMIKRLSAIEDLGGINIICSDKTGTLTKNVLKLLKIDAADNNNCLKYAWLASRTKIDPNHYLAGSFDEAIYKACKKEWGSEEIKKPESIYFSSFDPHFRWQFEVYHLGDGAKVAIKGAPESMVLRSKLDKKEADMILNQTSKLGAEGFRVLAVARKTLEYKKEYSHKDIFDLEYLGLLIFEDPIKETAPRALEMAYEMGLDVKIITGDAPEIALAVANNVGLKTEANEVITGYEMSKIGKPEREDLFSSTKIFARVDPKDKYQIIKTLAKKNSLMFLGEGINDAPSLKVADAGMVVKEASDIAKEAADIILTKPDLVVIIESIKLGRQIISNISKYILITLTGNFGSLYAVGIISIISPVLPLLPTQVLLENIMTDVPMISLVGDKISPEEEKRPVRQNIKKLAVNSAILGLALLLTQFVFYKLYFHLPVDLFRTLWLMEVILFEFMLIFSLRTNQFFWRAKMINLKQMMFFLSIILAILVLPYVSPLNHWFHLVPYNLMYLPQIVIFVIIGLIITEIMKKVLLAKDSVKEG